MLLRVGERVNVSFRTMAPAPLVLAVSRTGVVFVRALVATETSVQRVPIAWDDSV